MAALAQTAIQSEGDLEIVVLDEAHSALAQLIGPWLYKIGGTPPRQTAVFNGSESFDLFLILLGDFVDEGTKSAQIGGRYQNWSLQKGLVWLAEKYPAEARSAGLDASVQALGEWLDQTAKIGFWCPEVGKDLVFDLTNQQTLNFAANSAKHSILRLSSLLEKVGNVSRKAGQNFGPQELVAVLRAMIEELRGRFEYYATWILELLGKLFLALNAFVVNRHSEERVGGVRREPPGITSDIFRDTYSGVLAFKRYHLERITLYTPSTDPSLKRDYHPVG